MADQGCTGCRPETQSARPFPLTAQVMPPDVSPYSPACFGQRLGTATYGETMPVLARGLRQWRPA